MVDDADVADARAELRTTVQNMRGMADPPTIAAASRRAVGVLATVHGIQRARTVLLHRPLRGDLDPRPLAHRLAARGVRVLVAEGDPATPTVVSAGRGHLTDAHHDVDDLAMVEVVIVPGVAFDLDGGRLGPVDDPWARVLDRIDDGALRVGLARTAQLVPRVPRQPEDLVVDVVVTDHAAHHTGARLGPRDA